MAIVSLILQIHIVPSIRCRLGSYATFSYSHHPDQVTRFMVSSCVEQAFLKFPDLHCSVIFDGMYFTVVTRSDFSSDRSIIPVMRFLFLDFMIFLCKIRQCFLCICKAFIDRFYFCRTYQPLFFYFLLFGI